MDNQNTNINIHTETNSQISQLMEEFNKIENDNSPINNPDSKQSINSDEHQLNCHFLGEKGGMQGIDHEKINKIVYETTKNSRIFKRNEEDKAQMLIEVSYIKKKLENFHKNTILKDQIKKLADSRIETLKSQQRFDKIWLHIDMDMFFAAVEIRDDPSLANIPMAVGNEAMISTSNYIARKFGVRSAMPGFIAKKLCPNLKFVEGHYEKYKNESQKIMNILEEYDNLLESMGLDEAYVELTDYCNLNQINTKNDIINVAKIIKKKIFDETKLTCSVGIACNKTLAKICSDYKKPDGLFYLDFNEKSIVDFTSELNIRKIPFIGSKHEMKLNMLNIHTCKDLLNNYVDLFYLNEEYFDFYMKNCFGIGNYTHSSYQEEKSISRSESFPITSDKNFLLNKLEKLKEIIIKDMKRHKVLYCKTITIEIIGLTERKISKSFTDKNGFSNKDLIKKKCIELFEELLERENKIRMIRIKISGLVKDNYEKNKNDIFALLDNLKEDYKKGILPSKSKSQTMKNNESKCDKIFDNFKEDNNIKETHKKIYSTEKKSKNNKREKSKERKKSILYKDILNMVKKMKEAISKNNEKNKI